jgi:phospholipid N-methyltransferase
MAMVQDAVHFLRRWLADPHHVGAIAPSGRALANLITRQIHARSGRIAEFGAGTGVFTHALLKRGVREGNLVLIERDEAFAERLRERFPHAHVLAMDAERFGEWARAERFAAGAIVSGLPLRNFAYDSRRHILASAFASLCGDGALYQFTYGLACPVPAALLERLQLEASRVGYVLRNLPPATVYRIQRRQTVGAAAFA